ncbi:MAG: TlpA family protein disulfide reductase [Novosphingobium sp.]
MVAAGCDRQSSEKAQPQAAGGVTAKPEAGTLDRSHKGSELPDIIVTGNGQELRLTSLKGKPTLINLWATWCAPCIAELPTLNAISNRADLNLRVVTISQDTGDPAKVQTFLDQRGFAQLPAWIDAKGDLPIHYAAPSLPVSIYYDANGREVWRYAGGRDWGDDETRALLTEGGT